MSGKTAFPSEYSLTKTLLSLQMQNVHYCALKLLCLFSFPCYKVHYIAPHLYDTGKIAFPSEYSLTKTLLSLQMQNVHYCALKLLCLFSFPSYSRKPSLFGLVDYQSHQA
jgi:hypothetical protein